MSLTNDYQADSVFPTCWSKWEDYLKQKNFQKSDVLDLLQCD